jgi:hypothetical protein
MNDSFSAQNSPDFPISQNAPPETPVPKSQNKRIIVLVIALIIVFAFLILALLKKDQKSVITSIPIISDLFPEILYVSPTTVRPILSQAPELKITPLSQTNKEIAESTFKWISDKKDERGVYYSYCNNITCDKPFKSGTSGHGGLSIIWARFQYYKQVQNQNSLNDLLTDINNYSDKTKVPTIQNQNWNCKIMYSIWMSSIISPEMKQKVENICFQSDYFPLKSETFNTNDDLFTYLEGKRESLKNLSTSEKSGIREYSYYPSDFITRFLWKGNIQDLDNARNYFDLALRSYNFYKKDLTINDICALGQSSLDLYSKDKNQNSNSQNANYLIFAKQIFDTDFNYLSPVCGYFAESLYNIEKDLKYLLKKDQVTISLFKNNLPNIYELQDVGILVGLLLN